MGPFLASQALAQGTLDKLQDMKVTGIALDIPAIPQTGKKVDAINNILCRIQLPPGFKINLFTIVPDARVMFTKLNDEGGAESTEVFASGSLNESTSENSDRPVDVVELQDGSILVSDDLVPAGSRVERNALTPRAGTRSCAGWGWLVLGAW